MLLQNCIAKLLSRASDTVFFFITLNTSHGTSFTYDCMIHFNKGHNTCIVCRPYQGKMSKMNEITDTQALCCRPILSMASKL